LVKVAVVTGTTHGIGRVTARELAKAGLRVAMLCRNQALACGVRDEILADHPQAAVDVIACDLASLDSVRRAAAVVRAEFAAIDLLINNAGIVSSRRRMSADGFELTFATNHLGPFLLTQLVQDRIRAGGRIINVASRAHYRGQLELEHVRDAGARYRPTAAYAQSKLANVLHAFALARKLRHRMITANCLHPGVVATNLLPRWLQIVKPWITRATLDAERGARTTLHLALSDAVAGQSGHYFDENQTVQAAAPAANDQDTQEKLWDASLRFTGLRDASEISSPARE
jgi:NAD(P)-dependent dehydrogenase (short-subunit alcohol dehydrogenase family)